MSALSDFMGDGGGGFLPYKEFLNVTGTITLDLSKYSAFKVTQGEADLTINFVEDNAELRGEADLFLTKNPSFALTVNSDEINGISTGEEFKEISSASYDNVNFSVGAQEVNPFGMTFNNDGSKMYIVGSGSDAVYQYTLSTPFSVSTASYDNVSFSVGAQEAVPNGIAFNNDGSKMYIVGIGSDSVHQYTLSTPFSVATASYDNVSFSVGAQEAYPNDIAFNNDGSKMYIVGGGSDAVYQYTLSTPFSVATASYDNVNFYVGTQEAVPNGIAFNNDGSKMYIVGYSSESVYQYTLSTPFSVSTASYDNVSFSVRGQESQPSDIAFNNDGSKMYIVGNSSESVHQYTLTGENINKVSQFGAFTGIIMEKYLYAV
jgi:sugar lactone lactonase YvrE